MAAVTPPLSTTAADAHGLGNLGFVRNGAHLAVVFVSAGDDGSARSAADAHAALGAGREAGLFSAWVIAGDVDLGCSFPSGGRASAAYRYLELAHLSNTTIRSVCHTDEWSGLWNAVGNQAVRSQAVYRLDAPAATVLDLALVHVRPDGGRAVVPSWQWTYDAGRRAVVLQRLEVLAALLEQGGSLEVYYRLGCE